MADTDPCGGTFAGMLMVARSAMVLLFILASCSKDKKAAEEKGPAQPAQPAPAVKQIDKSLTAKIIVTVSVDWEGLALVDAGLEAMTAFRNESPHIPITHFICPSYFTNAGSSPETAKRIKAQVLTDDEVALHIHPWFSLVEKAGVPPRDEPSVYYDDAPLETYENGDKGFEVALAAYELDELTKLVTTSRLLLEENGLGAATAFRAGGFAVNSKVLEALKLSGLTVDSSATWPTWYDEAQPGFIAGLKRAWPDMQELTQPYTLKTEAGEMIEVPNTGGFGQFATSGEMLGHLQNALALSNKTGESVYVNFGFHQNSAHEYLSHISDALYNFREDYPDVLQFSTVTQVASLVQGG